MTTRTTTIAAALPIEGDRDTATNPTIATATQTAATIAVPAVKAKEPADEAVMPADTLVAVMPIATIVMPTTVVVMPAGDGVVPAEMLVIATEADPHHAAGMIGETGADRHALQIASARCAPGQVSTCAASCAMTTTSWTSARSCLRYSAYLQRANLTRAS